MVEKETKEYFVYAFEPLEPSNIDELEQIKTKRIKNNSFILKQD